MYTFFDPLTVDAYHCKVGVDAYGKDYIHCSICTYDQELRARVQIHTVWLATICACVHNYTHSKASNYMHVCVSVHDKHYIIYSGVDHTRMECIHKGFT